MIEFTQRCVIENTIANAKYRHTFGIKAKMLTADEVIEFVGHAIGGVCPFAVNDGVLGIYIDESVKRFNTIFMPAVLQIVP